MSIDTLLEAARYLEWEAQQQQMAREEDQLKQREAELRCFEVVTLSGQRGGVHHHPHHVAWGNDPLHLQTFHVPVVAPPSPSLPPGQVPIAVIPMVPVVTPTPSPLHPASSAVVAAATIAVATPMLNGSSPSHHLQQQQHPLPLPQSSPSPRPLLSSTPIKLEPTPQQNGAVHAQPPLLQVPYQACFGPSSGTLMPQHSPETRTNGLMGDDMRGADGKRRPGGAGTREVHNKLEKNRRAHLKECFEMLKKNVPNVDEKKTSNLSVLRGALRYIQTLKRKEKEYEHEMERLAREKIATQQRLAELKSQLSLSMDATEVELILRQTVQPEDDQVSTSTASEGEEDMDQDFDDEDMSAPPLTKPLPKAPPPIIQAHPLLALQHATLPLSGVLTTPPMGGVPVQSHAPPPQAIAPHPLQPSAVQVQPTVIAHAAVSHPSVIQAVHHKHLTHIAPSPGPAPSPGHAPSPGPAPTALQPVAAGPAGAAQRITVHPLTHLGPAHLPALYPQAVTVSQHITHTFTHHHPHHHALAPTHATANGVHVNGASLGKPAMLVGQTTVLNPVTLVKLT